MKTALIQIIKISNTASSPPVSPIDAAVHWWIFTSVIFIHESFLILKRILWIIRFSPYPWSLKILSRLLTGRQRRRFSWGCLPRRLKNSWLIIARVLLLEENIIFFCAGLAGWGFLGFWRLFRRRWTWSVIWFDFRDYKDWVPSGSSNFFYPLIFFPFFQIHIFRTIFPPQINTKMLPSLFTFGMVSLFINIVKIFLSIHFLFIFLFSWVGRVGIFQNCWTVRIFISAGFLSSIPGWKIASWRISNFVDWVLVDEFVSFAEKLIKCEIG